MAYPGPTANLKGTARRIGKSGTVWIDGRMRGEIVNIEWGLEIEQIPIAIPGTFQDEMKPGGETRRATFRYSDVDDTWRLFVWNFIQARRNNDRALAAAFPEFNIITVLDDIGAPMASRWVLEGCQLYNLDGGFGQEEGELIRDVPMWYRSERPIDAFSYQDSGVVPFRG